MKFLEDASLRRNAVLPLGSYSYDKSATKVPLERKRSDLEKRVLKSLENGHRVLLRGDFGSGRSELAVDCGSLRSIMAETFGERGRIVGVNLRVV